MTTHPVTTTRRGELRAWARLLGHTAIALVTGFLFLSLVPASWGFWSNVLAITAALGCMAPLLLPRVPLAADPDTGPEASDE